MNETNPFPILLDKQYDISYVNECLTYYHQTYQLEYQQFEIRDAGTIAVYHKCPELKINVEYVTKTTLQFYIDN